MIACILIACTQHTDDVRQTEPVVEAVARVAEPVAVEDVPVEAVPVEAPLPTMGLPPGEIVQDVVVEVQPGETLVDLAGWAGITVEELAELNQVGVTAPIAAGALLRIPADTDFEQNREVALDARLERYFEAHDGLVGMTTRVVRTGDTAWGIAREEGLPLWVVGAYNRPLHLSSIAIGDTLYLPVMGDQLPPLEEDSGDARDPE